MVVRRTRKVERKTRTGGSYKVKVVATTISKPMSKETAIAVSKSAKSEVRKRGLMNTKVTIVRA